VVLAGLVREQVLARAGEQVPRAVDVEIESITEPREELIRIDAPVLVETESRTGILIGAGRGVTGSSGVAARHQSTASWRAASTTSCCALAGAGAPPSVRSTGSGLSGRSSSCPLRDGRDEVPGPVGLQERAYAPAVFQFVG
jgi:hypothetical protein